MSRYKDKQIVLTTKHNKIQAIAPAFSSILSANVFEYYTDTDLLGTFSGEVERHGTPKDCVRRKCKLGMNETNAKYGLASEGSFGPHPYIGIISADVEVMIFIDEELDLELCLNKIDTNTNFNAKKIANIDDLSQFVVDAKFPSHGLILRPNIWEDKTIIFKGITSQNELENAFNESKKLSQDGCAWIETDMRANFNPSRMLVIKALANEMATRLNFLCPKCSVPGFGIVKHELGLECNYCGMPTDMIKFYIYGCLKCDYTENRERTDIKFADMAQCNYCNP